MSPFTVKQIPRRLLMVAPPMLFVIGSMKADFGEPPALPAQ